MSKTFKKLHFWWWLQIGNLTVESLIWTNQISEEIKCKIEDLLKYAQTLQVQIDGDEDRKRVLYDRIDALEEQLDLVATLHEKLIVIESLNGEKIIKFMSDQLKDELGKVNIFLEQLKEVKINPLLLLATKYPWDKFYSDFTIVLNGIKYYLCVSFTKKQERYDSYDKYSINLIPYEEYRKVITSSFHALLKVAEYRDEDTWSHLIRISAYSKLLATLLETEGYYKDVINEQFKDSIWLASPLHDIWKVRTPDFILLKPWKLTPEEFEEMKKHSLYWAELISDLKLEEKHLHRYLLIMAEKIAWTHHEKYDGMGYPNWLRGDDIPLEWRIVAVIDVFDALCSKRPYKEPFTLEKVREIMIWSRWTHFDPIILDIFLKYWDEFVKLKNSVDQEYWE